MIIWIDQVQRDQSLGVRVRRELRRTNPPSPRHRTKLTSRTSSSDRSNLWIRTSSAVALSSNSSNARLSAITSVGRKPIDLHFTKMSEQSHMIERFCKVCVCGLPGEGSTHLRADCVMCPHHTVGNVASCDSEDGLKSLGRLIPLLNSPFRELSFVKS